MRAHVDESVRVQAPGLYVLAAVLVEPDAAESVRGRLRSALPPGQGRAHWRVDSASRRRQFLHVIAEMDLLTLVTVCCPVDPKRQERARRKCLERMLWELEQRGVTDVLLETRREQDRLDQRIFLAGQRAGHLSQDWRYEFSGSLQEPLLWLPDYVAGVVSAAGGHGGGSLPTLGPRVALLDVGSGR